MFNDLRFLNLAFTHTSYANESKVHVDDNEKLEFLGDSVLGMITAEYLFSSFKKFHEGEFSKIKAIVVSEDSLSEVANRFSLDRFLSDKVSYKDYKTTLQEYLQKRRKDLPLYSVVGHDGPDHAQEFKVEVLVMGKKYGPAKGANKKSAEQAAAHMALVSLGLAR